MILKYITHLLERDIIYVIKYFNNFNHRINVTKALGEYNYEYSKIFGYSINQDPIDIH